MGRLKLVGKVGGRDTVAVEEEAIGWIGSNAEGWSQIDEKTLLSGVQGSGEGCAGNRASGVISE